MGASAMRNRHFADQGQGLILAVLIMLLIALFGAAFIAIVASNLSATAGFSEKSEIRAAAEKGRDFANKQLVQSTDGLDWRPKTGGTYGAGTRFASVLIQGMQPNDPPTQYVSNSGNNFDPTFGQYYDQFEQLRGYTSMFNDTHVNGPAMNYTAPDGAIVPPGQWVRRFVKYPDPLRVSAGVEDADTASFLLEVKYPAMVNSIPKPMVQLRSVGRASTNSANFHELKAFKPVVLFDNLRTVTNYDHERKVVPSTTLVMANTVSTPAVPADRNLFVSTAPGFGPGGYVDQNKHIAVYDSTAVSTPEIRLVQSSALSSPGVMRLTLAYRLDSVHPSGSRVEVAASLGVPTYPGHAPLTTYPPYPQAFALDFLGQYDAVNELGHANEGAGNLFTSTKGSEHAISDWTGGLFVNGSLQFIGLNLLRMHNVGTEPVTGVAVTGGIAIDHQTQLDQSVPAHPSAVGLTFINSGAGVPVNQTLVSSGSGSFPDPTQAAQLMLAKAFRDGVGRLTGSAAPQFNQRTVATITPPDIMAEINGLTRYRKQTAFSNPNGGSLYGYGSGFYLNNPSDVEDLPGRSTTKVFLEELKDLWMKRPLTSTRPGSGTANAGQNWRLGFEDIGTARHPDAILNNSGIQTNEVTPPQDVNLALEARHLRAWISDSEFMPRGAQIELVPNMRLEIAKFMTPPSGSGDSPGMILTMDELADARSGYDPANQGPDSTKSWRNSSGASTGVYSRYIQYGNTGTIAAPSYQWRELIYVTGASPGWVWSALQSFNRIVFAEGNLRVRGTLSDNTTTALDRMVGLTIVSMATMYIEGDLRAPQAGGSSPAAPLVNTPDYATNPPLGRIALLANYHVCANPTRIMRRPMVTTTVTGGFTTTLANVSSVLGFNINDLVVLWPSRQVALITATDAPNNRLTLDFPVPAGTTAIQSANHPVLGRAADDTTTVNHPSYYLARKDVGGRSFEPLGELRAGRSWQLGLADSLDGAYALPGHPRQDANGNVANMNQIRFAHAHSGGAHSMPTNGTALPALSTDTRDKAMELRYTAPGAGPNNTTIQVKLDNRQGSPGAPGYPEQYSDIFIAPNAGASAAPYFGKWVYAADGNVAFYLNNAVGGTNQDLLALQVALTTGSAVGKYVAVIGSDEVLPFNLLWGLNLAAFTNSPNPAQLGLQTTTPGNLTDPNVTNPLTLPLATAMRLYLSQPGSGASMLDDPGGGSYLMPDFVIGANRHTLTSAQSTNDFATSVDEKFYRISGYDSTNRNWVDTGVAPWYLHESYPSMFGNAGSIVATLPITNRVALVFDQSPSAAIRTWRPNVYRLARNKVEGFHTPSPLASGDTVQSRIFQAGGLSGNAGVYSPGGNPSPVPVAGANIEINAIVYAQHGSWFVIPGNYYDNTMWSTTLGSGGNAGSTQVTFDVDTYNRTRVPIGSWIVLSSASGLPGPGAEARFITAVTQSAVGVTGSVMVTLDRPLTQAHPAGNNLDVNLDFNRDGFVTTNERNAKLRFLRYNYSITFRGAICENYTAPNVVDASGEIADVRDWTDKWTYPVPNSGGSGAPYFRSIRYTYDTTLNPNLTTAIIPPHLPASPDLIEASG